MAMLKDKSKIKCPTCGGTGNKIMRQEKPSGRNLGAPKPTTAPPKSNPAPSSSSKCSACGGSGLT